MSPSLDASLRSRAETQTLRPFSEGAGHWVARAKAALSQELLAAQTHGGGESPGHAGDGPVMRMRLRDPLTTCAPKGCRGAFLSGWAHTGLSTGCRAAGSRSPSTLETPQ